jgi:carboxymethylenebutenolidase
MGEMIGIHQQSGTVQAYLSISPKSVHYEGAIIIVHELWGLTEQIKAVADRFAAQGYYALAPDLYSTDKVNRRPSEQLQRDLFSSSQHVRYAAMPALRAMIAPTQTPQFTSVAIAKLTSCFEYLYNQPLVHQKVGIVGFGLGGNYSFSMAMRERRLRAAIAFYGRAPHITAELRHIQCPVLALYGKEEKTLMKELNLLTAHMIEAGVDFSPVVYANTGHAFFNDANYFAYNESASEDAWRRSLSFLHKSFTQNA